MITIAFFDNKGGVGKTSLVYHLAWMYADLGLNVVAADLDPQANLTSMFLDEDKLEELWPDSESFSAERSGIPPAARSVYGAIQPLLEGTGDIISPHLEIVDDALGLLAGDLALATSEDELDSQWPDCLDGRPRAFRVISAFWRVIEKAAEQNEARLVLIDVGPNLGAINRAALICAQHVVIPLAPDLYSLQGLRNLGPTLRRWRAEWDDRKQRNPLNDLSIPPGDMKPTGYIMLQHAVRLDRPVKAYDRWISRIPAVYREAVLAEHPETSQGSLTMADDRHCLATLRQYRSLAPLAQEARKPMFRLTPADGAIGGHIVAVQDCFADFRQLALRIARECGVALP